MNMNKKKVLIVLALVLAAALAVGITIAWFTDTETVTNKATMGAVDVDLEENVDDPTKIDTTPTVNPDGEEDDPSNPKYTVPDAEDPDHETPLIPGTPTEDGAEYPESFPGTSYVKQPTVENLEQPAFVRLVIERKWEDADGNEVADADADKIVLHKVNEGDWTYAKADGKDIFYFNAIMDTDDITSAPFDYFTISSTVDNTYAKLTAKIEITVEAVQAAGLGVETASAVPADVWAAVVPATAPEAPAEEGGSTGGSTGGDTAN